MKFSESSMLDIQKCKVSLTSCQAKISGRLFLARSGQIRLGPGVCNFLHVDSPLSGGYSSRPIADMSLNPKPVRDSRSSFIDPSSNRTLQALDVLTAFQFKMTE